MRGGWLAIWVTPIHRGRLELPSPTPTHPPTPPNHFQLMTGGLGLQAQAPPTIPHADSGCQTFPGSSSSVIIKPDATSPLDPCMHADLHSVFIVEREPVYAYDLHYAQRVLTFLSSKHHHRNSCFFSKSSFQYLAAHPSLIWS